MKIHDSIALVTGSSGTAKPSRSGSPPRATRSTAPADAVVLQAATPAQSELRYTAGPLANRMRLRLLRRVAPARLVDTGTRRDLRLEKLS
ncbi:hypothetical protein [Montanilutibacter psychrotolerans]|uniref:hypothetical protein n=1 Tax=Montanilutibacter psychrotolerans TaxID=1327343 RepID=UPI001CC21FF5|nr:hypothetical protein [Lysobacter psychrotolerans]